jgi:hypothetical protein
MTTFAEDRARRWEPFGVTEADFAAAPERDGVRMVKVELGGSDPGRLAARWLGGAAGVLAVLAAGAAAVSWQAQYAMVWAVKQVSWVAAVEAGIPDAGALVFAALGVALALHGRRALRPRVLNLACIGISLVMNALAAGPGWRDLAIWVMPAAVYALASDTLIGVVRAWVLARQRADGQLLAEDGPTPLALAGGLALWLLRLSLAPTSTLSGFRSWVVTDCPVAPGARPEQEAELEAVRQEADRQVTLAIGQRDEAVERAAAEARQAREDAARAQAAEVAAREEAERIRSDASQRVTQALAAAGREREELRAWMQQQATGLQAVLDQARSDAARLAAEFPDAAGSRITGLETARRELQAVSGRLAEALRAMEQPRGQRAGKSPVSRGGGPTKRDRMIALAGQRRDLAVVPLAEVSRLASAAAAEIGYSPGTARRELVRHVRELQGAPADSTPGYEGGQAR